MPKFGRDAGPFRKIMGQVTRRVENKEQRLIEKFIPNRMLSYDDDALLAEVRRVVHSHFSGRSLSVKEFEKFSLVKVGTLRSRFGTWAEILSKAGVDDSGKKVEIRNQVKAILTLSDGKFISFERYKEFSGSYSLKDILSTFNVATWKDFLRTEFKVEKVFREIQIVAPKIKVEIQDSDLFEDIKQVWDRLGARPTYAQFRVGTTYSMKLFEKRFGGWFSAIEKFFDVYPAYRNFESSRGVHVSRRELLAELKRLVDTHNLVTINQAQYAPLGGRYSIQTYYNQFGSWRNAKEAAGLIVGTKRRTSDKEVLFQDLQNVWEKLGRQPFYSEFGSHSEYSAKSFVSTFGSWTKAIHEFANDRNQLNIEPADDGFVIEPPNVEPSNEKSSEEVLILQVKTPRAPSPRLRFRVLARNGFTCQACGACPSKNPSITLHIDHILPYSKGGETVYENLQTLCSTCNLGKSNL